MFSADFKCAGSLFQIVRPKEVRLFVPKVVVLIDTFFKFCVWCCLTGLSLIAN